MIAHPILLQKKYARVIKLFAHGEHMSFNDALDFFYHSNLYVLMSQGISDMHCRSDAYLAEELSNEYHNGEK